MIYLIILAVAASIAIGRLWLVQRRSRSHLQTVEGFQTGLRRLSEPNEVVVARRERPTRRRKAPPPQGRRHRKPRAGHGRVTAQSKSLDPERRAAAKERIAARRAARQRAYG
jgi:hypothetical protein